LREYALVLEDVANDYGAGLAAIHAEEHLAVEDELELRAKNEEEKEEDAKQLEEDLGELRQTEQQTEETMLLHEIEQRAEAVATIEAELEEDEEDASPEERRILQEIAERAKRAAYVEMLQELEVQREIDARAQSATKNKLEEEKRVGLELAERSSVAAKSTFDEERRTLSEITRRVTSAQLQTQQEVAAVQWDIIDRTVKTQMSEITQEITQGAIEEQQHHGLSRLRSFSEDRSLAGRRASPSHITALEASGEVAPAKPVRRHSGGVISSFPLTRRLSRMFFAGRKDSVTPYNALPSDDVKSDGIELTSKSADFKPNEDTSTHARRSSLRANRTRASLSKLEEDRERD
jgi:hypothetical protein